jgi:microcystin-dependent protein
MFAGNFPPSGWLFCNGQSLPISENDVLFQLIGTMYGGDGQEKFNLPNLQSRVPMHAGTYAGQTFQPSEMAGVESVTLTTQQIPVHNHSVLGSDTPAVTQLPGDNIPAQSTGQVYTSAASQINMDPQSIQPAGGSQPHTNVQPYLCINFIISLFGIFPQQS